MACVGFRTEPSETRNCTRLQAMCVAQTGPAPKLSHPLAAVGPRIPLLSFWVCALLPRQGFCSQEALPGPWDLSIQSNKGNLGP